MKKNANILKRVEQYKYKRGIVITDTNSSLYKAMRILATLSFIYLMAYNLLYISSQGIALGLGWIQMNQAFVPIIFCTAFIILGYVLNCTKLKLWGCLVCIPSTIINCVLFWGTFNPNGNSTDNIVDATVPMLFGMPTKFYVRHIIPALLLLIFMVVMVVVDVSARIKNEKLYNHIMENLYVQYQAGKREAMSEEEWTAILNKYDASGYKNQFDENSEENASQDENTEKQTI